MVVPTTVQFHLINSLFNLIPTLQRSMLYVTQHMTKDAYQNFKEVLSIFPIKYSSTYSVFSFTIFFWSKRQKYSEVTLWPCFWWSTTCIGLWHKDLYLFKMCLLSTFQRVQLLSITAICELYQWVFLLMCGWMKGFHSTR